MSDKHFSQLNGYKVKDAEAHASIAQLSNNVVIKNAQYGTATIITKADDFKNATDNDIVNRGYVKAKLANINTGGTATGGGTQLYKHVIQTSRGKLTVISTKASAYTAENFDDLNDDTLIAYLSGCTLLEFDFDDSDEDLGPTLYYVAWDISELEIIEFDVEVTGLGNYTPTKI